MKPFGFFASVLIFALGVSVEAAGPYYIDYASGNDAKNGTSPTTPFQRHPYMTGFSGSYTHTAGDQFYFKGGVTWPSSCFPIISGAGGTSPTVGYDYYGTNSTYFSGASFTKPVFDDSGSPVNAMSAHTFMTFNNNNIRIDSIVVTNLNYVNTVTNNNIGIYLGGSGMVATNVDVLNFYPTGAALAGNVDDLQLITSGSAGNIITHCRSDGRPANLGIAKGFIAQTVEFCTECFQVTGTLGEVQFCDNNFYHDLEESISGTQQHSAAISQFLLPGVTNYCYNNIVSNCSWGEIIYITTIAVNSDQWAWGYCHDNLALNNTSIVGPDVLLDPEDGGGGGTRASVFLANNTLQSPIHNGYISVSSRPANNSYFAYVTNVNEMYISEVNVGIVPDPGIPTQVFDTTDLTNSNTQANSEGYTLANGYAPTQSSSPSVAAGNVLGLSISTSGINGALRGSKPDIGAYQFAGGLPSPTAVNFRAGSGGVHFRAGTGGIHLRTH